jgi:pimeloyl-ACP methyl ester carboxylesterase
MSEIEISQIRVPGASLHYEVRGAGPIVVMLQGGDGDADGTAGIADHLVSHFTIVTYDRRGLARSKVDPGSPPPTIETHATDVHHLLEAITHEPALVFGASLGALIGLELVSRHPEQVRLLVAHEPPSTQVLADAERELAARSQLDVEETFRLDGIAGAMQKFAAIAALDLNDREADASFRRPVRDGRPTCSSSSRTTLPRHAFIGSTCTRCVRRAGTSWSASARARATLSPRLESRILSPPDVQGPSRSGSGASPSTFPGDTMAS